MVEKLCSVIMPAYNSEKYIKQSIESVLAQTYCDLELLIVDDCSTDSTKSIIEQYALKDKRIKPVYNSTNLGCAESRNVAISLAMGEYIAFIDSDDVWELDKLNTEMNVLQNSDTDLVYSAYNMVDCSNKTIKTRRVPYKATLDMLLKENFICFSTIVIKSSTIRKIKMDNKYFHEDYCLLLDLLKEKFVFSGIDKVLVKYKISDHNRSKNKLVAAKYRWMIYREYLKFSKLKSLKYFLFYIYNGILKYYV